MKRLGIISTLLIVFTTLAAVYEAGAQTAYGISIVRANSNTRIVDGYSGTWLDYYAGLYYDPEVIGDIYRTDNPEASLATGRHIGYADIIPAEVVLQTSNFVEGKTYCTYSQHSVWSYYYTGGYSSWFDPFRYSFSSSGYPPWPGSTFGYYWVIPRRHFLGWTEACVTIPVPPPPTPTPTPTPNPTPTPCDPLEGGSCNDYTVTVTTNPTSLRPTGVSGVVNSANVSVCIEPAQANLAASIQLVRRAGFVNTGGHVGSLHVGGQRPMGKLASVSGVTGANGCFYTKYSPSHISGYVGIDGTITGTTAQGNILVRVDGLFDLGQGVDYRLIGDKPWHPQNHFGTGQANISLHDIAADYRFEFYPSTPIPEDEKVAYNDVSLEYGGKFEVDHNWLNTGFHGEHREGINCDTRSINIPPNRHNRLMQIFFDNGSTRTNDERNTPQPHWHLRFEYNFPASIVQRTPHMFVEDTFDAALLRESSQTEYQNWFGRITNAKATGQAELLLEAKALQKTIYAESEYGARHRTDTEFVQDVFASHLYREPTVAELNYWVSYLQNLPPSVPIRKRRPRLLDEFQSRTEFQDVVLGLVDPTLPAS